MATVAFPLAGTIAREVNPSLPNHTGAASQDREKDDGGSDAAISGGGDDGDGYDAFLSYAHDSQRDVARPLVEGLARRGVSVWRDEDKIGIGDILRDKIKEGTGGARHGIVVVSPGYLVSSWGQTELGDMFGKGLKIFPILHGVSVEDARKKLPAISESMMRAWEGSAELIMDEIADAVKAGRSSQGIKGAPGSGGSGGWKEALGQASRGSISGMADPICGDTISRKDESDSVRALLEEHGRVVVIGDKGSGKTVLMQQVYESLADSHNAVLVKADDFLGIGSPGELDVAIAPGRSFVQLARAAALDGKGAVVIIDSLDSIARDKGTMAAFKQLVKSAWGAGARTIVTVRGYDYRYSESISATNWGAEYNLGPLSKGQVAGVMKSLGNPRVSDELRPLLANPLNLYIFSKLVADSDGDKDFTSIMHEIGLYDAHWDMYVDRGPSRDKVATLLYGAARAMAREGRMAVPLRQLGDADASGLAQSASLLRRIRRTGRVAFFHHAYLDYTLSRAMLEDRSGIMKLLESDEHNLFVRPTLPLTLAMAHDRSPREFARIAAEMLRSGLKHYWKTAAAAALARASGGSADHYRRLGQLLTEKRMLQRHFLAEAAGQKNAFWLGAWGGSFLQDWAGDKENPNGAFLVGYVQAAASADPGSHARAFDLLKSVAENNQSGDARQKAVESMAAIDAAGRAAWLRSASESGDVRVRSGVGRILPELLRSDPGSIPDLFASLLAYEETSGEQTVLADAGSMRFMSNPAQDNAMIKWGLDRAFPGMLRDDPHTMIKAAVRAAERAADAAASGPWSLGDLLNVRANAPLHSLMPQQPKGDSAVAVQKYLEKCSDGEFDELVPLLAGSRHGPLRSILIDGMARRGATCLEKLVEELADPRAYESPSMRASVKGAIAGIAGALDGGQLARILAAIMRSNPPPAEGAPEPTKQDIDQIRAWLLADKPEGTLSAEEVEYALTALGLRESSEDRMTSARRRSSRLRANFLAAFPDGLLNGEHLDLVRAHRPSAGAARPQPLLSQDDFKFREMPDASTSRQSPEDTICSMIGEKHDREGKIALLESISAYLEGPSDALDAGLLPGIEKCLLENARDPNPDSNAADKQGKLMIDYPSVRGLAALCLAKLVAIRGSRDAEDALRKLSDDPSNIVRGSISRGLAFLLPGRRDLAYPILDKYSRDADPRVRFFLGDCFAAVVNGDPVRASAAIGSMLAVGGPPMLGTTSFLLHLALEKKDSCAASLLERVAGGDKPHDIRLDIPFTLKPYLSSPAHRDAALGLLYKMLDAGPDDVRSKAAFFVLNGYDGDGDGGRDYVKKIRPHLGLMVSLLGSGRLDLQAAEYAVQFLKEHWRAMPGTALSCLEAIARGGDGLAHQPVLAQCTAGIISGMIERYRPGDGEWGRCLDVLDVYATAGWPEVADLLSAMERPD